MAVALPGRREPIYRGEIKNDRKSLQRLIARLSPNGEVVSFCHVAGPCGYGAYRETTRTGHPCTVVAPSLIPRRPGERVKTDRRDALMRARLHRAGELKAVWVPGDRASCHVFRPPQFHPAYARFGDAPDPWAVAACTPLDAAGPGPPPRVTRDGRRAAGCALLRSPAPPCCVAPTGP